MFFCKVCWVLNERGQWVRRRQQERGRCGRVEVRDHETDETRGIEKAEEELEWGRRQRHSLVHSFSWLTARREDCRERGREEEREEGRSARSEHVSVWVASLIRRCCQGPQRGGCRDPTSPFSSLSTGPWDPAGKMIDEWYQDKHGPWPPKAALRNDAYSVINKPCEHFFFYNKQQNNAKQLLGFLIWNIITEDTNQPSFCSGLWWECFSLFVFLVLYVCVCVCVVSMHVSSEHKANKAHQLTGWLSPPQQLHCLLSSLGKRLSHSFTVRHQTFWLIWESSKS